MLKTKEIPQNGAKRRQLQFIGKIMRNVDVGPIRAQLEEIKQPSAQKVKLLHAAESWRERMINGENGLKEFVKLYPKTDSNNLKVLIVSCRETMNSKSKTSYRDLFKVISISLEEDSD